VNWQEGQKIMDRKVENQLSIDMEKNITYNFADG